MELWGGIECTINRIGNDYHDQLALSGHYLRPDDAMDFAALGIKAIRYPILWERHQPTPTKIIDWDFTAKNISVFKKMGVEVIAGLVHHGSGPAFVNILDEGFITGLASYAGEVAARFPWISHYTPVNEPLTTARFCGLYGLWHPHKNDDASFLRILINECRATVMAMKAIREINPMAKLVQTEDIGKVHSTDKLAYQAEFENARRWLSFDLLNGKVDAGHDLYGYLLENGIAKTELDEIQRDSCPPDILGANYYVTSERYLDEKLNHYPAIAHGGNGHDSYVDIEAVRSGSVKMDGPENIFEQVWMRYQIPIAITEVHLHCGREDQIRWLKFIWEAAEKLNNRGVDVVSVTLWSLLGAYGWNSLLTGNFDQYEAGAFDVQSGLPRETAIGRMARQLAKGESDYHPVLQGKGWWDMPSRILYGTPQAALFESTSINTAPIIVFGAETSLGRSFVDSCYKRNLAVVVVTSRETGAATLEALNNILEKHAPWAAVNASGYRNIDLAEQDALRCYQDNTRQVKHLATACSAKGVQLLTFSTDMVFDGTKSSAYEETDVANPLNLFGKTKLQAEYFALDIHPETLIIRSGPIFDNIGSLNILEEVMPLLKIGKDILVPKDIYITASFLPEMVAVCLDLLIDGERGIWHLSNPGELSWYELACMLKIRNTVDKGRIVPINMEEIPNAALRPHLCIMGSIRGSLMSNIGSVAGSF